MFQWLRLKVRNAVLAGVGDAVEYLEGHGASEADESERMLEERVELRLGHRPEEAEAEEPKDRVVKPVKKPTRTTG